MILAAGDPRSALRAAVRWATRTQVLAAITCLALANVGARALLGQAVPGDFVQEVAGARALAERRPLYPPDINEQVRVALTTEPPTIPRWLPRAIASWLETRQREGRNRLVTQAHPPTLLITVGTVVRAFGAPGAYWALTILSLAAAAVLALVLLAVWAPTASARERILVMAAVAAWQPVLSAVREGQSSVLIAALIVFAWQQLRSRRDLPAGFGIGAASTLKLYPMLLLIPLGSRKPRALAAAAMVITGIAAAATVASGTSGWQDYAASASLVARAFSRTPYNVSLLPRLAALLSDSLLWITWPIVAVAATIVTFSAGRRQRRDPGGSHAALDVDFARFTTLALLLSPVAWCHSLAMLALPLSFVAARAWAARGRGPLAAVVGLALALSLPDDLWRGLWRELPPSGTLLVSSGTVVFALWLWLVCARRPVAAQPDSRDREAAALAV